MTRFLLRETVSQLQALQSSLEGASDTLETQARGPRYMRSPDNLWVQFTNAHYLHVPSPSTLTTFQFQHPGAQYVVLGREAKKG